MSDSSSGSSKLINLVHEFVHGPAALTSRLPRVLDQIARLGWSAALFGGVLRDLMLHGRAAAPRDIDIVVDTDSEEELYLAFQDSVVRRTRFGGLAIDLGPWRADVWSLRSTWAFQTPGFKERSFSALPRTTFLDVEAIAVELPHRGCGHRVFDFGFFAAVSKREIEINFEPNPFPELCVVRALVAAQNLDFSFGQKLVQYLLHWSSQIDINDLLAVQRSHYGKIILTSSRIEAALTKLQRQAQIYDRPALEDVHSTRSRKLANRS